MSFHPNRPAPSRVILSAAKNPRIRLCLIYFVANASTFATPNHRQQKKGPSREGPICLGSLYDESFLR
jgi:hypothetical protein